MGSNKTPIKRTTPKPIKISDKIRKGRSEGKTIVHHVFSPFLEASTATPGKEIRARANRDADKASTIVLNFERNKLYCSPFK
ncbi:hypothetical protein SAFG77S_10466 [Streptomyces afghaniensis]